jgi:hypothetical protein
MLGCSASQHPVSFLLKSANKHLIEKVLFSTHPSKYYLAKVEKTTKAECKIKK